MASDSPSERSLIAIIVPTMIAGWDAVGCSLRKQQTGSSGFPKENSLNRDPLVRRGIGT